MSANCYSVTVSEIFFFSSRCRLSCCLHDKGDLLKSTAANLFPKQLMTKTKPKSLVKAVNAWACSAFGNNFSPLTPTFTKTWTCFIVRPIWPIWPQAMRGLQDLEDFQRHRNLQIWIIKHTDLDLLPSNRKKICTCLQMHIWICTLDYWSIKPQSN